MVILNIPSSESINWRPSLCAEDKQQSFVSSLYSFAQRMQYIICEITYSLQNSMSLYDWDTLRGGNCQKWRDSFSWLQVKKQSLVNYIFVVHVNWKFTNLSPGPARYLAPGIRTGSSSLSSVSWRAESLVNVSSRAGGPGASVCDWGSGLLVLCLEAPVVLFWSEAPGSLPFSDKVDSSATPQGLSRLKSFLSPEPESSDSEVNLSDCAVRK